MIDIPPIVDTATFCRLFLAVRGVLPSEIPPVVDTHEFRSLALQALSIPSIPPNIDEAEFRRSVLLGLGVFPELIPPSIDTATWRRLVLSALYFNGEKIPSPIDTATFRRLVVASNPDPSPTFFRDFATNKTLNHGVGPQITFSRDSLATYVDSDGYIVWSQPNEPRFTHDTVTGESYGLLIEDQRTNLLKHSFEFSNVNFWEGSAKTYCSINETNMYVSNRLGAGDTPVPGSYLVYDPTQPIFPGGVELISRGVANPSNAPRTFSIWIAPKALPGDPIQFFIELGSVSVPVPNLYSEYGINLNSRVSVTGLELSGTYEVLDGKIHIICTTMPHGIGSGDSIKFHATSGTAPDLTEQVKLTPGEPDKLTLLVPGALPTSGTCKFYANTARIKIVPSPSMPECAAYLWGAQLEVGPFASSFIPTFGTWYNRKAEIATVSPVSSFFNEAEGTIIAFARPTGARSEIIPTTRVIAQIDNGTLTNRHLLFFGGIQPNGSPRYQIVRDGVNQAIMIIPGIVQKDQEVRLAAAYDQNNYAFVKNGATTITETSGNLARNVNVMRIGRMVDPPGGFVAIGRLAYHPVRLSNQELLTLTQ